MGRAVVPSTGAARVAGAQKSYTLFLSSSCLKFFKINLYVNFRAYLVANCNNKYFFTINHGFNAHFVCYIFQFLCVPFAGRRRRPIAVER